MATSGWCVKKHPDNNARTTHACAHTKPTRKKKSDAPLDDAGRRDGDHLGEGVGGGEVLELLDQRENVLAHLLRG